MEQTTHTLTVPPEAAGQRLDKWLAAALADLSRAQVQRLIAEERVTADGAVCADGARKVKAGQQIAVTVPPAQPLELQPVAMPLEILFEDADVVVLNKPAGLTVHPAPGERNATLVHALLAHCGDSLSGIGGVQRPGIVHRLDKDTSGAIIVAKNDAAHQSLAAQLKDRSLSRTYHAIVYGVPKPAQGTVDAPIARSPKNRKKMAVGEGGKPARTHYKVLEVFGNARPVSSLPEPERSGDRRSQSRSDSRAIQGKKMLDSPRIFASKNSGNDGVNISLVECRLESGRTHQIRVHLAHIGHPLVGDPAYGRKRTLPSGPLQNAVESCMRQALHAQELQFIHPRNGKTVICPASYAEDFAGLLAKLRGESD